jgi:hypothetical protein
MMLPVELVAGSGFGTLLGVRHALEPDHLAAVSTLVNEERSSYRAALLGVSWGLGHTSSLVIVGTALVMMRADMPARVAELFELAVAMMLVGLGLRAISSAARKRACGPADLHREGTLVNRRLIPLTTFGIGGWTLARRPLLYGIVHGLAGSGALTALVLTTLPSTAARLTYMALFGIGSTLGMAVLSGLLGWPIARIGGHHAAARGVALLVGCLSAGLGMTRMYPLLIQFLWEP